MSGELNVLNHHNPNLLSVYGLLEMADKAFSNKEAIYDLKRRIAFSEIKRDADKLAAALAKRGINKGDRVAIALPNWYETIVVFFAVAKIGATLVPFNPMYKAYEVHFILKNSEPTAVFVTEEFRKNNHLKELLFDVPIVISVRFEGNDFIPYQQLVAESQTELEQTSIDAQNDVFCILYTSGTTGVPKGVMITHQAIVKSALTLATELKYTENDVLILPSPLFHIFGMAVNLFCAVSFGSRIVLLERFQPQEVLSLIEQEQVSILNGVPTMFIKLLETENFDDFNLASLRTGIVGASPIPASKVKEIRDRLGINLCQSFGITETVTVTMTPYEDEERNITETLGKPIPGVELKIVDENRITLPAGETGEIAIKGFGTMKGYYQLPEQTATVLDNDGWFYSGDLGVLNEKGYLTFVGRKKEMIIRGGFNIYPGEIEAVLAKHPKVVESAVIGLPDQTLGEIVCAIIKLKSRNVCTEEEVISYLKEHIAIFKVPQMVIFTDAFPVTASGKIQKLKLREEIGANISRTI